MLEDPAPESPQAGTSPLTFVGRDRDLHILRERLALAFSGHGGLVLLSGEAGIGKTTLVSLLADEARDQGATVLTGGCYDLTSTPPYGPWREAFAEVIESGGLDFEQASSKGDIFEDVLQTLTALSREHPTLLVLDDLHWADPASLDLLRLLGRHLHTLPLLTVAMYRITDLTHPLALLVPIIAREAHAERIDLGALEAHDVRYLVARRYGLAGPAATTLTHYLMDRAEGSPFYTGEILRTLEAERRLCQVPGGWVLGELDRVPVPPLVRQVIERRLSTLDPQTRQMLEIAAVIGQVVEIDLWQRVGKADDATLLFTIERAIESRLMDAQPAGDVIRFHHALTRDALYDGILPPRVRAWHRDVAEELIRAPSPDPDATAHHFQRSGDPRALPWLIRAGLRAWKSAAWLTAAERFTAAAGLLAGIDDRRMDRAWLLFATGYLLRFSQNNQPIEYLDEAEAIATALGDPILPAYVMYHRGISRCLRGDVRLGLPEAEKGVVALEALSAQHPVPGTDDQVFAVLFDLLAGTEAAIERPRVPTPDSSGQPGEPTTVCQRGPLVAWLGMSGHAVEALEMGEFFRARMFSMYGDEHLKIRTCVSGHFGLGHAYALQARPDEARQEFEVAARSLATLRDYLTSYSASWFDFYLTIYVHQAELLAERARIASTASVSWRKAAEQAWTPVGDSPCQALLDVLEGRWERVRHLAQTHEPMGSIVLDPPFGLIFGMLARYQGDSQAAWEYVHTALPDGARSDPANNPTFAAALGYHSLAVELALDAGDLNLAHAWLEALDRWNAWSRARIWLPRTLFLWAQYHALAGDLRTAMRRADAALELARETHQTLVQLAAHRFLGQLQLSAGRFPEAEQHLAASLSLAEACAVPYERAQTLLRIAELRAASGNMATATTALDEARTICTALGARPVLDQIDQFAAQLAESRPATRDSTTLSRRELEVLSLVAEGKTDREIAADLFISHHTVMTHVSNILNKLGVDSRSAAAAQAIRRNLL